MKKSKFRIFITMIAVMICFTAFSTTAFAGGGENYTEPTTTATETPTPNPVALTPDGNLTLVDDVKGEQAEDKQFVTLVSKNGNYFYLVIDRAGDKENVYFLNLVDEADLLALIEEETPQKEEVEPVTEPTPEPTSEPEPQPEQKNNTGGILVILLIVGALGGGAFYYFRFMKNKPQVKGHSDLDEYDFDDDDEDEDSDEEYETEEEVTVNEQEDDEK